MLLKERNANNAWHKLARNKTALVGFFIVVFMVILAVFAPLIAPYDPNKALTAAAGFPIPANTVLQVPFAAGELAVVASAASTDVRFLLLD